MKKAIFCVALCLMLLVSNVAVVAVSAEDNYADNWVYLTVGEAEYETDTAYEYTVFHFEPEETGKYTIACSEQPLALAGYNWVTVSLSADTVNANSIEWSCSAVGQGIIVAVASGDGAVGITVTREDLVQKEEVQWTIYENTVTPAAFTLGGDSKALANVSIKDAAADEAVLGADGYYHLNAADGPVLYANVKDAQMSLATVSSYGQLKEVIKDENGEVVAKIDYNTAVADYISASDSKTGLYPLTADLIEIFQGVGSYQGWYGENGFVGGTLDDAWMFACYYGKVADVNYDGAVDAADAVAVFAHINGTASLTGAPMIAADLNADGAVSLMDAVKTFYIVNGVL